MSSPFTLTVETCAVFTPNVSDGNEKNIIRVILYIFAHTCTSPNNLVFGGDMDEVVAMVVPARIHSQDTGLSKVEATAHRNEITPATQPATYRSRRGARLCGARRTRES